jgi:hypothetical protein
MKAFFRLIQRSFDLRRHATLLSREIGAETFDVLIRSGVLEHDDPADWYPCPGLEGDNCPMRVVPNPGHPTHAYIAVCGNSPPRCQDVYLNEEDLVQVRLSQPGTIRMLRSLFKIKGDFTLKDEVFPGVLSLGDTAWSGHRDVFLATDAASRAFPSFLTMRRQIRGSSSLILAPSRRWIEKSLIDQHDAGERVEIAFLEDTLSIRNGEVVINPPIVSADVVRELPAPYRSPAELFCRVIDQDGERLLTEAERRELQARASELDLFIDMISPLQTGRYRATRRNTDGTVEEVTLTGSHAAVLTELISKRKPLAARQLNMVDVFHPDKAVELARSKVDVKLGRYQWRAFHTLPAITKEAKRFVFNPPADLCFTVLLPLPTV